jgi:hypothetical protein
LLKLNIGYERFYLCRLFTIDWFTPEIVTVQYNSRAGIKSFLPIEAEISVTKVFITANMKNSKSCGKQEADVR